MRKSSSRPKLFLISWGVGLLLLYVGAAACSRQASEGSTVPVAVADGLRAQEKTGSSGPARSNRVAEPADTFTSTQDAEVAAPMASGKRDKVYTELPEWVTMGVPPDPLELAAIEAQATSGRTKKKKKAPELVGITGWINSGPFTLGGQQGKVVLVDFWTYTCVNCIRTFPYLNDWHEKYANDGLVIVGVHTPEFDFEKHRPNVVEAAGRYEIKYAIAQDNNKITWRAFRNSAWPTKYLIDKDGYIRYTHLGEGAYDETEQKIRELLVESGGAVSDILPDTVSGPQIDPSSTSESKTYSLTRQLYFGYKRNYGVLLRPDETGYISYKVYSQYYEDLKADTLYEDPREHLDHHIYL